MVSHISSSHFEFILVKLLSLTKLNRTELAEFGWTLSFLYDDIFCKLTASLGIYCKQMSKEVEGTFWGSWERQSWPVERRSSLKRH